MERDYGIFREIDRWRFCLGRHIKVLAGFSGQRACDRRLRTLIEAGFIERKKVIYGIPGVYSLTYKAKMLIGANKRQDAIRLEHIAHDIAVLDTAIYFVSKDAVPLSDIVTEKQLHSKDGFSTRDHQPDFTFTKDGKTYCVEVELTLKSKDKLEKNVKDNFLAYDVQVWVVGDNTPKLVRLLNDYKQEYPNVEIIEMEGVKNYVSKLG